MDSQDKRELAPSAAERAWKIHFKSQQGWEVFSKEMLKQGVKPDNIRFIADIVRFIAKERWELQLDDSGNPVEGFWKLYAEEKAKSPNIQIIDSDKLYLYVKNLLMDIRDGKKIGLPEDAKVQFRLFNDREQGYLVNEGFYRDVCIALQRFAQSYEAQLGSLLGELHEAQKGKTLAAGKAMD
jgi:hypothetical protein